MEKKLSVSNLLGIKYLSVSDINLIFETADSFKEVINRKIKKVPSLRDITIANLFFENSTRTKISFELAQKRLSADVINFSSSGSSITKGETLTDTVNNILSMKVDMVVIRHPSPGASIFLSKNVNSCIINAGDGCHEHPTQALLDAFTLRERFGSLSGKKILITGDIMHSRVALSNIFIYKKLGAKVMVSGPKSLIPKYINDLEIIYESNFDKALKWCDVASMLRIQNERMLNSYFPSTFIEELKSEEYPEVSFDISSVNKALLACPKCTNGKLFLKYPKRENGYAWVCSLSPYCDGKAKFCKKCKKLPGTDRDSCLDPGCENS